MGQAKLRGTRDERIEAAISARSDARALSEKLHAQKLKPERLRAQGIREADEDAVVAGDENEEHVRRARTRRSNGSLSALSRLFLVAALGAALPPQRREVDYKNMPDNLEDFENWRKGK